MEVAKVCSSGRKLFGEKDGRGDDREEPKKVGERKIC